MSVYIGSSPREREKEERNERREKKCPNNPPRTYCKHSRLLPYFCPNLLDAPALEVYPAPSRHLTTPIELERRRTRSQKCALWNVPLSLLGNGGDRMVQSCWVNFECQSVKLSWNSGQVPTAFAVGTGRGCLNIFLSLVYLFSFSLSGRRPDLN